MERRGIVGAGNWIIDKVKNIDRWPGEGNLCNILNQVQSTGGGPANVLFDLAVMDKDLPLYAAGVIGVDKEGDFVMSEIARHGVDSSFMKRIATRDTSFTDVMSGEGKRTFFHCRGANSELDCATLDDIDVPAKFFYLGYLLLLDKLDESDPEYGTVAARLLDSMLHKGYRTIVDFVSEAPEKFRRIVFPALPFIDILIVNEIEASACSSLELRRADGSLNVENLPKALDFMFEHGVRETAVIHFPEGAAGRHKNGEFVCTPSCRVEKSEIVGSTGAGDAFCAGMIYALHENFPMEKALRFGCVSSRFNLLSATASDGAVPLAKMIDFMEKCSWNPALR